VLSTWGARDGNQISRVLDELDPVGKKLRIPDVADAVNRYLKDTYRPHERGSDPVGFHVAGFVGPDVPKVYHAYWDPNAPETKDSAGYGFEERDPGRDGLFILWNGRGDLVEQVLVAINGERQKKTPMPLKLDSAAGMVQLGHLALRFAREVSFDVGPPFIAHIVTPSNEIHSATLPEWVPLNDPATAEVNRLLSSIAELRYVQQLFPAS
jgi:hypothetical protein